MTRRKSEPPKKKRPPRDENEAAFGVMQRIIERTEKASVRKPRKKSKRR